MLVLGYTTTNYPAYAQNVSAGATADQIEKRFESQPEAKSQPRYIFVPRMSGFEAPAGAEKVRFVLQEVTFPGMTVYSQEQLADELDPLLGEEISLDQVYALANRLTSRYGNDGYLLSRAFVPPQTIENGVIRIRVLEGYIDEVILENYPDDLRPDLIQHYINKIKASRPLTSAVLERYLMLANDISGLRFKSVLSASQNNIGASTLTLAATQKSRRGMISFDNYGSDSSGPWQVLLEGGVNNLFGRLETTTLRYATVPEDKDELQYLQVIHQQTLNGEGLKLQLDASFTESTPGTPLLELLDVETESQSFGASLSYPLIRSREKNLTLNGGIVFRQSETRQFAGTSEDRLNVVYFGGVFDQVDTWGGGGINLLSVNMRTGIDGLAGFDARVNSRQAADPTFTAVSVHARRSQVLNDRLSLDLRLSGLLSSDSLPSSEEFSLGGENSVRGYEPSEFTGNEAVAGSIEISYRPELDWNGNAQLYGFYDSGQVFRDAPNTDTRDRLSAWGVGTRVTLPGNISMNIEAAKPIEFNSNNVIPGWQLYGRIKFVM